MDADPQLQRVWRTPPETEVICLISSDTLSWKQRKWLNVITLRLNGTAQSCSQELSLGGSLWIKNHKFPGSHQHKNMPVTSQGPVGLENILFFSKSLKLVLNVQMMAIIYAAMWNYYRLNPPKTLMKFCNVIFVYTAQKTGWELPPMAPGSQLCSEMKPQAQPLCKTPDYYQESTNREVWSQSCCQKQLEPFELFLLCSDIFARKEFNVGHQTSLC